eukprot:TRINITY_DN1739_c0_g2_i1.p3 TRINITY_DN1739_c0_g2~~TRINITY_DN1739_c0_g2_i1.p3  ORF type:complete len:103 (+),score=38.63 TRINITY_DN1739_c0_g2_i1:646-954(+)
MISGIYNVLTPSGIYISVSYGWPAKREEFFKSPAWNWKMSFEKVTKPTISTTSGVTKEEGADQKNFIYVYILKKEPPPPEEKPVEKKQEQEKSNDENDNDEY